MKLLLASLTAFSATMSAAQTLPSWQPTRQDSSFTECAADDILVVSPQKNTFPVTIRNYTVEKNNIEFILKSKSGCRFALIGFRAVGSTTIYTKNGLQASLPVNGSLPAETTLSKAEIINQPSKCGSIHLDESRVPGFATVKYCSEGQNIGGVISYNNGIFNVVAAQGASPFDSFTVTQPALHGRGFNIGVFSSKAATSVPIKMLFFDALAKQ
ncbi:hypothetical protein [Novosphingobium barchaimii]|uniref:hypothetical protein n=1 Tax=Novosphingobium barchaimii TaxID=1420591 RepID=UPI000A56F32D|nr:hypothetical protein [Novosphingobium barchaimii]